MSIASAFKCNPRQGKTFYDIEIKYKFKKTAKCNIKDAAYSDNTILWKMKVFWYSPFFR